MHWENYKKCLIELGITNILNISESNNQSAHMFAIMTNLNDRDSLMETLGKLKIKSTSHYQPLHSSNAGLKYGKYFCTFENSDGLSKSILRLPMFFDLQQNQITTICEAISEYYIG